MLRRSASSIRRCVPKPQKRRGKSDRLLNWHQGVASVLNMAAEAVGVEHRVQIVAAKPSVIRPEAEGKHDLSSALRYMTQTDIEIYADRLVGTTGRLVGVPTGVEKFVYSHCVKILLCLLHDALDRWETNFWGLKVSVTEQTARRKLDLLGSLERRLKDKDRLVDVDKVTSFIDKVIQVEREDDDQQQVSSTAAMERLLHRNVSNIVLNLIADVCSTYRMDFFGHAAKLTLTPTDLLEHVDLEHLRAHKRMRQQTGRLFDDDLVNALTDEILADKDLNLPLVPDYIERNFYRRFFSFYGVLLDYALSQLRLSLLDVETRLHVVRDDTWGSSSSQRNNDEKSHDASS